MELEDISRFQFDITPPSRIIEPSINSKRVLKSGEFFTVHLVAINTS